MKIFQLVHVFNPNIASDPDKTLKDVRARLENDGAELTERLPTHTNFKSNKDKNEIAMSIHQPLHQSVYVLVERGTPDDKAYIHPSSLRNTLPVPKQIDFQTFPEQVYEFVEKTLGWTY